MHRTSAVALALALLATPLAGQVVVTPDLGATTKPADETNQTVVFYIQHIASPGSDFDLSCAIGGKGPASITNCQVVGPNPVFVPLQGTVPVTVSFTTTSTLGTKELTLTASTADCTPPDDIGCVSDQGSWNVTVTNVGLPPLVDASPWHPDFMDYGRCASACFAAIHAQGTVPYFSRDEARAATLVYNSDRVNPRPFVLVDVAHDTTSLYTPTEYRMTATINGAAVTFLNGDQTLRFAYPGPAPHRLGGQFDAASYVTGVYPMVITVSAVYGNGNVTAAVVTRFVQVNETSGLVARGWTLAGIQRAHAQSDGSMLVTDGSGGWSYFADSGSAYVTPAGDFSRLVDGQPGGASGYTRLYPDSTRVAFNPAGEMTRVISRFGDTTTVTYSPQFKIAHVVDPHGLATRFRWSAGGLDSILAPEPGGRMTRFARDASGRLTSITDPDGVATGFGYDAAHRLTAVTDRNGQATQIGYQTINSIATGKVATITLPAVPVFGQGTVSPVTTLVPWQSRGLPYSSTSGTPAPPHAADTLRATVTEPGGAQHRFTVNRYGQPRVTSHPLGQSETLTYNAQGQPVTYSNSAGSTASWGYDLSGFNTTSTENGRTTWRRNGGWGQADSIVGPNNSYVARLFLSSTTGAVLSVRRNSSNQYRDYYTYASSGRLASVVNAHWQGFFPQTHLAWSAQFAGTNGNRSKDSLPGNRVTTYGYDSWGRLTSVTPPGQPVRTTTYDVLNRPLTLHDGVNPLTTRFAYDSLYLRSVTDPRNQVYAYRYNALGWTVAEIDPLGRADSAFYTRDGDVARWRNRRGQSVDFTYDVLHRRLVKSGTNVTPDTLGYSPDGRVVAGATGAVRDSAFYSVRGLLDSTVTRLLGDGANRRFARRYWHNSLMQLDSSRVFGSNGAPNGFWHRRRSYAPGTAYMTGLGFSNLWTTFALTSDGLVDSVAFSGYANFRTTEYSALDAPVAMAGSPGFDSIIARQVGTDLLGRVREEMLPGPARGRMFGYDGLGRLVADTFVTQTYQCSEWNPDYGQNCWNEAVPDSVRTFAYDSAGNRIAAAGVAATFGWGNRLATMGSCSYTHDFDGNLTSRTGCGAAVTYTWDAENRLTAITTGGTTTTLQYDAFGRLSRHWGGGTPNNWYLWDGASVQAVLDSLGASIAVEYSYYPGLDNLHAVRAPGNVALYAHADALGNVIALTNQDKQVRRTYAYDEWGQLVGGTDTQGLNGLDRARYKGALWLPHPSLELYYMRNRWYEPGSGRFLSEDPIGVEGGMNLYAFASGDPVNRIDPVGTEDCWLIIRSWVIRDRDTGEVVHRRFISQELVCYDEDGSRSSVVLSGGGTSRGSGTGGSDPTADDDNRVERMARCALAGATLGAAMFFDGVLLAGGYEAARVVGGGLRAAGQWGVGMLGNALRTSNFLRPLSQGAIAANLDAAAAYGARAAPVGTAVAANVAEGLASGSAGNSDVSVGNIAGAIFFTPSAFSASVAACN